MPVILQSNNQDSNFVENLINKTAQFMSDNLVSGNDGAHLPQTELSQVRVVLHNKDFLSQSHDQVDSVPRQADVKHGTACDVVKHVVVYRLCLLTV